MNALAPVLYLPHGGGPLPLLNDQSHLSLIHFLKKLAAGYQQPTAIVIISAHWETAVPSIYTDPNPALLFDYYGFPPETYSYTYPAQGHPELAHQVSKLVNAAGMDCKLVHGRGFDHGMFVPMMLLYPQANIPCIQVSLIQGLDARQHIKLGQCLAPLRERNIAIIGSGMSFHNLQAIFAGENAQYRQASDQFDQWLVNTMSNPQLTVAQQQLEQWQSAPHARFCHPREEHLLPLHVCFGAAMVAGLPAQTIFNEPLMGHKVAGFRW